MPNPSTASNPEEKAARAAEELVAEGKPITARAVRERAGVSMAVATDAARTWNERAAELESVPDLPDDVQARFEGVWRAAYVAARKEFDEARAAWVSRYETAQKDVAALTKSVSELEEQLAREQEEVREEQRAMRNEMTAAHARAAKAEGALEAVTAERDRLLVELESARKAATR